MPGWVSSVGGVLHLQQPGRSSRSRGREGPDGLAGSSEVIPKKTEPALKGWQATAKCCGKGISNQVRKNSFTEQVVAVGRGCPGRL